MKKRIKLGGLVVLGFLGSLANNAFAQSDSALNRSVTVERDFQPIIQAAGKGNADISYSNRCLFHSS